MAEDVAKAPELLNDIDHGRLGTSCCYRLVEMLEQLAELPAERLVGASPAADIGEDRDFEVLPIDSQAAACHQIVAHAAEPGALIVGQVTAGRHGGDGPVDAVVDRAEWLLRVGGVL